VSGHTATSLAATLLADSPPARKDDDMAGACLPKLPEGYVETSPGRAKRVAEAERRVPRFPPDYVPPDKPEPRVFTPPKNTASARRGKFNNVPTDGAAPWGGTTTYPSAGHARVADRHAQEKAAGLIIGWSIECRIIIGQGPRGYRRHKVDFIARMADDRLRLTEFKGFDHADGKQRRADLEAMGFVVEVVK
jgi:hypothetical protein